MQIVANWHSGSLKAHKRNVASSGRVKRVLPVYKVKRKSGQEPFEEQGISLTAAPLNAEAAINTQILMTDFALDNKTAHNKSQALILARAYGEALERKVHQMDKGSFYEETA